MSQLIRGFLGSVCVVAGAAQAAEVQKQASTARKYYQQVAAMCHDAPAGRPDLDLARTMAK